MITAILHRQTGFGTVWEPPAYCGQYEDKYLRAHALMGLGAHPSDRSKILQPTPGTPAIIHWILYPSLKEIYLPRRIYVPYLLPNRASSFRHRYHDGPGITANPF